MAHGYILPAKDNFSLLCPEFCIVNQGRIGHVANVSIETGLPSKYEL